LLRPFLSRLLDTMQAIASTTTPRNTRTKKMAAATLLLSIPPVELWNVSATTFEELAMLSMQLTFLCGVPRLAQVLGLYSIISSDLYM